MTTVMIYETPKSGPFAGTHNGHTAELEVVARKGHAMVAREDRGYVAAQYWCGYRPTLTCRNNTTVFFETPEAAMAAAERWASVNDAIWQDSDGRYFERLAHLA